MKTILLSIISLLVLQSNLEAQQNKHEFDTLALKYLLKEVISLGKDPGRMVVLPLPTEKIRDSNFSHKELPFWTILKKYFPDSTRPALRRMIENSSSIGGHRIYDFTTTIFPDIVKGNPINMDSIRAQYAFAPVFQVSNFIYSADRHWCIVLVGDYEMGSFTVEMYRNTSGNWAYSKKTESDGLF
jgi:hypothetical protein